MNDIIIDIINTVTPSGYEIEMYQKLKYYIPSDWNVAIDNVGNIYCRKNIGKKYTLMIEGHFDEVGLMVNYITSNGYLLARPVGNISPVLLHGCEMTVLSKSGRIIAVAGHNPAVIMGKREDVSDFKDIWFDVCGKTDECRIGDYIVYPHRSQIILDKVVGAGIDNKASVAAMLVCILSSELIIPDDVSLCFCFSAREEILHKGIQSCIEKIRPDIVISLDATYATDVPKLSSAMIGEVELGKGPALLYDPCCDRCLTESILELTIINQLPIQSYCNMFPSAGLNVTQIENVKTTALLLPCRNMHSSVEMCSLNDIYTLVRVLQSIVNHSVALI